MFFKQRLWVKNPKPIFDAFPRSITRFYLSNALRFGTWRLFAYLLTFWVRNTGHFVLPPLYMAWAVGLLESGTSAGMIARAASVAALIIGIDAASSLFCMLELKNNGAAFAASHNKAHQMLHGYVYSQSSAWYSGTMSGKISKQESLIVLGFEAFWRKLIGNVMLVLSSVSINMLLILRLDYRVAAVLVCSLAIRAAWCVWRGIMMNQNAKRLSEADSALSGTLIDSIANFQAVKSFAGAKFEQDTAKPMYDKYAMFFRKDSGMLYWLIAGPDIMGSITFGLIIILVAKMFTAGHASIAEAVFMLGAYNSIDRLFWEMIWGISEPIKEIGMASEAYKNLIAPISVSDKDNAPDLKIKGGKIYIENISFRYGKKRGDILSGLDLNVRAGERIGLVGLSGSGKTTLVNLIMRLYDPQSGGIKIDGQDLRDISQDSLHRAISFIPQDSALFHRSLADNIRYGKMDATRDEIERAAKQAGAHDFIMKSDNGYDTLVGDRGIKLSGGQRQRIAIARAFLKNAPILILDEATSALDSETEQLIQKSFHKLSAGKTTIAIAHRLSTLHGMDRIVVMDKGIIIESGSHADLLKCGGLYAKLWKMQSGGFIKEKLDG